MAGAGAPKKYELLEIQQQIYTARDRAAKAAELIDQVVAGGGDLDLVLIASESVEEQISQAVRRIYRYKE